jgi:hypothetical protein
MGGSGVFRPLDVMASIQKSSARRIIERWGGHGFCLGAGKTQNEVRGAREDLGTENASFAGFWLRQIHCLRKTLPT